MCERKREMKMVDGGMSGCEGEFSEGEEEGG